MRKVYLNQQLATSGVILLVCVASIFLVNGCRKVDRQAIAGNGNAVEERFFNSRRSSEPLVQAITKLMKGKNDKHHFAEKTVKQIGYPYWDKAMVVSVPSSSQRTEDDSINVVYVPFVEDSQNVVNASLVIRTTPSDTTFSYLFDWQYKQLPNSLTSVSDSAEKHALFFMLLDNFVFGHEDFIITDTALFKTNEYRAVSVRIELIPSSGRSNVLSAGPICINAVLSLTQCTTCPTVYPQQCWSEYYGLGSAQGETPPLGGNEGGPGGGWAPGGGTNPPPLHDSTIANKLKKFYLKAKEKADSLHTMAQQDGNERAFSYQITNNDTIVYNIVTGNANSSSPSTAANIYGLNHTHQDNGLPPTNTQSDANQTFDTDDVFKFYSDHVLPAGSKALIFQTLTTRDYVYAAYITDINLFKTNIIAQAGTSVFFSITDNLFHKFDSLLKTCTAPPTCTYERQSELALLAIFGNNSGIKFFKSPRNNINFIKL